MSALQAISPLDGRYASKTAPLAAYSSESALIRYRVRIEVEYLIALTQTIPALSKALPEPKQEALRKLYKEWSTEAAQEVKDIEATTNHDVKAVEYYIKRHLPQLGLEEIEEFVHFGLTSQDVNNTAFPLMLREALHEVYLPTLQKLIEQLRQLANEWHDVAMLARTHGQPASPTRLGKEIMVFVYRLEQQTKALEQVPITGKFGGATGNFNAHHVAYPAIDWVAFGNRFLTSLGLEREQYTTQISNYDNLAALFEAMSRINTILIDLARDFWSYISMSYFGQKIKAGEVGSSAMPHKVNPIDFENAEGNLGLANAVALHLASKLPISRLQRDLTDSTVIRNQLVPMGYALIAFSSLSKGLGKLVIHPERIAHDLDCNWAVVAEAIQTILRREGYPHPYETLKALTRTGEEISQETIANFINTLEVAEEVKEELRQITPHNYVGL